MVDLAAVKNLDVDGMRRRAESLLADDYQTRLDRTLTSLARVFGISRRGIDDVLQSCSTHDWRLDPFSRGAYSYIGTLLANQSAKRQAATSS